MKATMPVEAGIAPSNPVMEFVRSAFGCIARPSLWKRRRELSIRETLSLGNRNFLAVVEYREYQLLIASTPTSISLLADVTREPAADADREEGEAAAD